MNTHTEEREQFVDALDHIVRVANRSASKTRRLGWISARAQSAIDGNDSWRDLDLPRTRKQSTEEIRLNGIIKSMQREIDHLKK